ncbi:hypothetical protein CCZ01_08070 [Helicobacter monodelphidis]|uniref:hypothetical protein n=1 Tax=Helicobacter sp. 15-1451 TaxID=2004995 RepID=UPI000DCF42B4|nr:hypothetical protein [Helicobacter sp. 15-1451]RAX56886.1 hypothetical protein CCZ01_08070 [Helicobacter sp. 15-1451]
MDLSLFYAEVLKHLEASQDKMMLDMVIVGLIAKVQHKLIWQDKSEMKKKIALLLREKCYEFVLAEQDVFEKDYMTLYPFFVGVDIPFDERFKTYADIARSELKNHSNIDTSERVILLELASVSLFLMGNHKEALGFYMTEVSKLHLYDSGMLGRTQFVLDFFSSLSLPFEEVEDIFLSMFNPDNFFENEAPIRRSFFVWAIHQWWNVPSFFNHFGWLALYARWREIFYIALEKDLDFAIYVQFFIYHMMGNSYQSQEEWKVFNDEITKKAEPYYIEYGKHLPPCKKSQKKGKKLIGILKDRAVQNSPFKVEYSFLKAFLSIPELKGKYEFKVYLMGFVEKSDDDLEIIKDYQELGIEVIDVVSVLNVAAFKFYTSHLSRAMSVREQIIADGVDIILSPNNGYGISDFILATRSAPLQVFWSHGNAVYDIKGIDRRISHFQPDGGFQFEQFSVPMDIERFYNPPVTSEAIFVESNRFPHDKVVLGVIGRLVKVNNEEFLSAIAEVMHQYPETIFIAAGHGNYDSVREKMDKLGIGKERFFMPGHIDAHIYGHIIDIFCNTFPLQQGESLAEYASKCKGVTISLIPSMQKRRENVKRIYFQDDTELYEKYCPQYNLKVEDLFHIGYDGVFDVMQPDTREGYIKSIGYFVENFKNFDKFLTDIKNLRMVYEEVERYKTNQKIKEMFSSF